ncbi:MAG: class B sortase [Firmicutes bacterium]|nr:class B sortase [Bacillota bacterium]
MIKSIARAGNMGLRLVTGLLAAFLLIYGLLSLWGMSRAGYRAFSSHDLLKYRPKIEMDEPPDLHEIMEINPDTVAWITLYGTNIDYPVMQGKTDMEYINKDAYGNHSISGSIFLSSLNSRDLSEPYQLIYGHHMDNGAMFGDIDKFGNREFFDNAKNIRSGSIEGLLITEEKVFELKAFAFLRTDAFDEMIYKADKNSEGLGALMEYLDDKAEFKRSTGVIDHVLALSTCDSGSSYGRMVLFLSASDFKGKLPIDEYEETIRIEASGHPELGDSWALMDLLILLLTVYISLPINAVKKLRFGEEQGLAIACLMICAIAEALFHLTENMMGTVEAISGNTPLLLTLSMGSWFLQYIRYMKIGKVKNE